MTGRKDWFAPLADYEAGLSAGPARFHVGLAHGSMTVELYRPQGTDLQTPHRQDEIYIIRQGTARFERDGTSVQVGPGDSLFVPAGMEHRFHDFSADFDTWVVFWGPAGGEQEKPDAD
ncbi:MAG: cupin domain-containing protein [Proteobacteria bacterium]|nr:cupin domain-containing protein [Pseudomonadota bacterium]